MRWIDRQKNILAFALSSLLRRRAKNTALIAVFTLVIFLLASVMFYTHSIKREASMILEAAPPMVVQRLVMGRHDLIPYAYAKQIKEITGVRSVTPRLWGYYYDPVHGANYTLMVNESLASPGETSIGQGVARILNVRKGGVIPIKTYSRSYVFLKITNTFPSDSEMISSDLIIVSEADFREIFSIYEEAATDLVLEVGNPLELATIAKKITALYPDTRPILRSEILSTYEAVFDWRSGITVVVLFVGVLAFIVVAWDKATGLNAEEKREIGILKGFGWETSDILLMKYWEGFIISFVSFSAGICLAYIQVFMTSMVIFEPALKGWSVLYPRFTLTPYVDAYQITSLFFLTILPYVVATIFPSWRAATIDPDTIMRL
jgi:ABC-type lipoprotein release transport system permease subunit